MGVEESGTDVHVGTARDADLDAAASGGLAVAGALAGGLGAVVNDLREWESGQLGSSEHGGRAESKGEAHEAGEVDSSRDHCCGRVVCYWFGRDEDRASC